MTQRVSKPQALLNLRDVLPAVYNILKRDFYSASTFTFFLDEGIDAVTEEQLANSLEVAAFTMRKLQLLYLLSQAGVTTTNDTVVGLCREITRSLRQLSARWNPDSYDTLKLAYRHLTSCGTVVSTLIPGEIFELH
jgi:hypothetical protein